MNEANTEATTDDQSNTADSAYVPEAAPVGPNNPPWNSWVAIGVWILSVVFILVVPTVFLAPYLMSKGVPLGGVEFEQFIKSDPTAVILQLAPVILAHALTLIVAWFVVTRFNTYSFRETLGWKMGGFRVWHAILLTVAFFALAVALQALFGQVENEFEAMLKSSRYAVYLVAFFATFTAPLVEEVVYRGLLYSAFQRKVGAAAAVVLVTLLFTAVHVPQYSVGANPDFATVIALLLLSLTLTLVRATTGSLLPCVVFHTVFNGIQSVLLIAQPYLQSLDPALEPTKGFICKFWN